MKKYEEVNLKDSLFEIMLLLAEQAPHKLIASKVAVLYNHLGKKGGVLC